MKGSFLLDVVVRDRSTVLARASDVEVRRVSRRVHARVRPRAPDARHRCARARESSQRVVQRALHRALEPLKSNVTADPFGFSPIRSFELQKPFLPYGLNDHQL